MEWAGPGSARPQQQWDQESVEAWLDDHWDFTFSYFVRKGTREMVNAWFAERVHTIPVCKEGVRGHTEACSCPSQQSPHAESSVPGTPTRKISTSEFDRPLRPIVIKDSEGTVSFLSDSEKKEQMPLTPPRFDNDEGDQCSRLLELVKDISSHLDVTALCHKMFLHIHGLISADRYSLFLVCEDSSNDKFLISRLFDVAEGSTLEEASNNCIRLEWNKGIVGHVAALGEPLNIKDAYEHWFHEELLVFIGFSAAEHKRSPSVEVDTHSQNTTSSEGANHTLLIHSPVELKRGWRRQKQHLFLYSDVLLISNTKCVYMACSPEDHKIAHSLTLIVGKYDSVSLAWGLQTDDKNKRGKLQIVMSASDTREIGYCVEDGTILERGCAGEPLKAAASKLDLRGEQQPPSPAKVHESPRRLGPSGCGSVPWREEFRGGQCDWILKQGV
ncbi:cGMP-specific 3',5'-cyclic phosphodiesterase-like [Hippopotamus amphibius kiboko]|uniref:cGMP-specific 3',5'-cyclic phosphodiesterase-like n=1 Tax=Hippopotamus amphibius kiboko TaxID=575201 RepID=UPI0025995A8E|nr:cGMP-specific 3',5'-cyclic phosphodiesterase-like [Hippopotamus amphibius kiboko]